MFPVHVIPGLMQDMPQAPSQRHFFFLLLQSSSEEHFRKHFWVNRLACSSSRGQSELGEFRGFLYTRPSSSASVESSSEEASQSSSSSSSAASVTAAVGTDRATGRIQCQFSLVNPLSARPLRSLPVPLSGVYLYNYCFALWTATGPRLVLINPLVVAGSGGERWKEIPFSKMAATKISTRNHFFMLCAGDLHSMSEISKEAPMPSFSCENFAQFQMNKDARIVAHQQSHILPGQRFNGEWELEQQQQTQHPHQQMIRNRRRRRRRPFAE